jgi:uncharacterized protein (UPF0335 family)
MAQEAKPGMSNGYDGNKINEFLGRVENLEEEIASIMGTAMAECKAKRDDIKEVYSEAKDAGLPMKPLKAEAKLRKLDRDKAKVFAGLNEDDQETLEQFQTALGPLASTPLGEAALSARG